MAGRSEQEMTMGSMGIAESTAGAGATDGAGATSALCVECRDVVQEFGSGANLLRVLRDVSLDVRRGELLMLVGPSGCGKTTLLTVIAGLLTPTSGTATVLGQCVTTMRDRELVLFRRRHLGFVFQQYNLLPTLDVTDNAAIPLIAAGVPRREAHARAQTLLSELGLSEHLRKRPGQLSGGQQQRVAIARALVHEPDLLICDEPTAALDGKTGASVMEMLRMTALRGDRSVLVVTHDSRIFGLADRIAHMEDGRIVGVEEQPAAA